MVLVTKYFDLREQVITKCHCEGNVLLCFGLLYFRCHDFRWHGEDPNQKGRMIPGHNRFTQLAVVPDQFYYNVSSLNDFC